MKRLISVALLFGLFSIGSLKAQSEEDVRAFVQFLDSYKKSYEAYISIRNSKVPADIAKAPKLLQNLLEHYANPVVFKKDDWGDISTESVDIAKRFKEDTYFGTLQLHSEITFGQVLQFDLGEGGSIVHVLKYDNEEEYDKEKDYFYYDVVKSGPTSWEEAFKVKKVDGKFKIYEFYYKEF
jgi:hypothetical protein